MAPNSAKSLLKLLLVSAIIFQWHPKAFYWECTILSLTTSCTIEKTKYFYIAGFFLVVSPDSIQLVAEHAAVFMMNLSASFICEFFKDALDEVWPYMDFVFGYETEARSFYKVHGWGEIALKICQLPKASRAHKRITSIKQGADLVCVEKVPCDAIA